jgi:DNA modification methylase
MTLHHGDCLEVLRTMPDNSVDSIVTDPPYGLSFMGKKWDYDVPSEDIWRECLRVLKPGGHLLAFAGTRTQHRMAVRIEDAGFEIRDMIAWVYGSGFPKSLDVSKAIDKAAGAEREVVGKYASRGFRPNDHADTKCQRDLGVHTNGAITAPATEAARNNGKAGAPR